MEGMQDFEKLINDAKKQIEGLNAGAIVHKRVVLDGVIFPGQNMRGIVAIEPCLYGGSNVLFHGGTSLRIENTSPEEAEKALCQK